MADPTWYDNSRLPGREKVDEILGIIVGKTWASASLMVRP